MSKPRRKPANWPAPPAEIPPPRPIEPCYVCRHTDYHAVSGGWACVTCHPAPGYVAPVPPFDIRHAAILRWGARHDYPALVLNPYTRMVTGAEAWRRCLLVVTPDLLANIRVAIKRTQNGGQL